MQITAELYGKEFGYGIKHNDRFSTRLAKNWKRKDGSTADAGLLQKIAFINTTTGNLK